MQIDVALDDRELRRPQRISTLLGAFVGGATRQRHEAAQVAQHGFAESVRKERRLRPRRVQSCAEERAERRGSEHPKRAPQSTPGQKRRERCARDDQHPERGCTLRFRVELPFGRAHAEIAGLVNEVDRRAAWGGLPDSRPAESTDEERLGLVPGDVGGCPLNLLESRFDIKQRKFARNLPACFGAKSAGIRDLARRNAMGLLREVVVPEPYAVARRQVVRRKMDLHSIIPCRPRLKFYTDRTRKASSENSG